MDEPTNQLLDAMLTTAKAILTEAEHKSAATYRAGIFDAARAYWKEGVPGNFYTRMRVTIRRGLNEAWEAGAATCGVAPDEFETEDKAEIERIISEEYSHVSSLLSYLDSLANDPTKTLADADSRLEMWAGRWQDVYQQALVWFGGKLKLEFVLGATENHCHTDGGRAGCANLAGFVLFAKEWNELGIKPGEAGSSKLACHGYRCKCRYEVTKKRRTVRGKARVQAMLGG